METTEKRLEEIKKEMSEYRKLETYIKKFNIESAAKDFLLKTILGRLKKYRKLVNKMKLILSGEESRLRICLEEDTEEEEYYADFIDYVRGLEFDYGYIDYDGDTFGLSTIAAELHIGLDQKIITFEDCRKELENDSK